jgi:hypothetical protein
VIKRAQYVVHAWGSVFHLTSPKVSHKQGVEHQVDGQPTKVSLIKSDLANPAWKQASQAARIKVAFVDRALA